MSRRRCDKHGWKTAVNFCVQVRLDFGYVSTVQCDWNNDQKGLQSVKIK